MTEHTQPGLEHVQGGLELVQPGIELSSTMPEAPQLAELKTQPYSPYTQYYANDGHSQHLSPTNPPYSHPGQSYWTHSPNGTTPTADQLPTASHQEPKPGRRKRKPWIIVGVLIGVSMVALAVGLGVGLGTRNTE